MENLLLLCGRATNSRRKKHCGTALGAAPGGMAKKSMVVFTLEISPSLTIFEIWNRHKPTQLEKSTKRYKRQLYQHLPGHLCSRLLTFLKMSSSYHDMVYTQIPQWMTMKNKNEQKTLLLKKYPKKIVWTMILTSATSFGQGAAPGSYQDPPPSTPNGSVKSPSNSNSAVPALLRRNPANKSPVKIWKL